MKAGVKAQNVSCRILVTWSIYHMNLVAEPNFASIDTSSDNTVDISIATEWSAVGSMSMIYQCSKSFHSQQYPSSNGSYLVYYAVS